jgi:hypothetical protein
MIYELMIRSRNDVAVPIETRHRDFRGALAKLAGAWKKMKVSLPPVTPPAPDELVCVSLTGNLPGVKQAQVTYVSREATDDDDCNDDFIYMAFSSDKVD